MKRICLCLLITFLAGVAFAQDENTLSKMELTGDWSVRVTCGEQVQDFAIEPAKLTVVTDESYGSLPPFNPAGAPWRKAQPLLGVQAQECAVMNAYLPGSLTLKLQDGTVLEDGRDYQLDVAYGNIGRLEGGRLTSSTPVLASYQFGKMRIDAIVRTANGSLELLQGESHVVNPALPAIPENVQLVGTVWISGRIDRLSDNNLFPTSTPLEYTPIFLAKEVCPKTVQKLENGERVVVLAWGDSVTACGFIPDKFRWQQQFAERLQARYPNAEVVLLSEGWGGRNSRSYLNEPAGSPKNFKEKVLDLKPDLIVSEFVNDAGLSPAAVEQQYSGLLASFQEIGAEWIICAPHYVRADWMGLPREKGIDSDPRPYVTGIRDFARAHRVGLADASFYYGQLYRLGIPYSTLMKNNINHPNEFGMSLFADALMKLFP